MADIMLGQLLHRPTIDPISDSSPLPVQFSGSLVEKSSAQYTEVASTVKTYNRAAGASRIDVFVESGYVRVRTDGQACTATTGEPIGAGFCAGWPAASISVYYSGDSTITVVSR